MLVCQFRHFPRYEKGPKKPRFCEQFKELLKTSEWIDEVIKPRLSGTSINTLLFYHTTLKKLAAYAIVHRSVNVDGASCLRSIAFVLRCPLFREIRQL
jgi:hypothetical protein